MVETITIKTPQFRDKKIDRWHIQKGTLSFYQEDRLMSGGVLAYCVFYPLNKTNGDHKVYFHSQQDLKEATL